MHTEYNMKSPCSKNYSGNFLFSLRLPNSYFVRYETMIPFVLHHLIVNTFSFRYTFVLHISGLKSDRTLITFVNYTQRHLVYP